MTDAPQGPGRRSPSDQELAAYMPPATRGREARLGAFVILGLLSFVIVLYWLTDPAMFRGRHILHSVVNDAGGVRRGDQIQMNGVNIGQIAGFDITPGGLVTITLEIEKGWRVPLGSSTRLGAAGMFGGRVVEVVPTLSTTFHEDGDTIPGVGGSAGGILGSMDELSGQTSTVLTQLESFLSDETIGSVQGGARELEATLSQLQDLIRDQGSAMGSLIETLQASAEGLDGALEAGPELASAISRADSVMVTLNRTSATLETTLMSVRSVLFKVDSGQGTVGRLVNDPALYTAYLNLSLQMSSFLEDFRDNPKKYINISIF
jgi:phospholipid/cholesterol/gamma-HCH transport system substrate-binding protein